MKSAEKISKAINTIEGQEIIKKWFEENADQENDRRTKREKMLSNTDYIKWLENFTIEHQSFEDNDWGYFPHQISQIDNENVNNLHLLYEIIELYAEKNYIYPSECGRGYYYNITLDNICYEIGYYIDQGIVFFCNRKPYNEDLEYIDFNNIMCEKKNSNITAIESGLNMLSNLVTSLYKNGVSLEAIITTLDNTINEINQQNNYTCVKKLERK